MATKSNVENVTRAWVDIDLGALLRNGEAVSRHARVPLLPMVKADAYGLGVVPVARALDRLELFGFGVATVDEGRELRAAGVDRRILVFTTLLPGEFTAARAARLTPALSDAVAVSAWIESGGGPWHLAIDTGMNRAGVRWDEMSGVAEAVRRAQPEGAFTHFHSAEQDDGSMLQQEARFREALAALPVQPAWLHAENSAAIARRSPSPWALVRPGVFLYGVGSDPKGSLQPEPVVRVCARIVELRDVRVGESVSYGGSWTATRHARVATLAVGYGDGYRRSLGNRGIALVRGARAPVVGTVTMDMTMIDVTGVACARGDVVTLIGRDDSHCVTVEDAAAACHLSPYELLTGLRQRLPRRYQ